MTPKFTNDDKDELIELLNRFRQHLESHFSDNGRTNREGEHEDLKVIEQTLETVGNWLF